MTSLKQIDHFAMWDTDGGKVAAYTNITKIKHAHTPYCYPPPSMSFYGRHTQTQTHMKRQAACPAAISTFTVVLARLSLSTPMSLMTLALCLLSA